MCVCEVKEIRKQVLKSRWYKKNNLRRRLWEEDEEEEEDEDEEEEEEEDFEKKTKTKKANKPNRRSKS